MIAINKPLEAGGDDFSEISTPVLHVDIVTPLL